ncbi:MAG: succinoglycan biosynthesis transport protein ExoP [Myxococcota bacterium]
MRKRQSVADGLNLARILTILRRWWWMLVVVVAIAIGVAYAVLERVTPVYRATSTVIVAPKAPRVLDDVKEVVELPDGGRRDFGDYMQTQLDIIRSQKVAAAVLDALDYWDDERLFPKKKKKKKDESESEADAEEEEELEDPEQLRLKRATSMASRIKARRVTDSLIIQIQFEHRDAELAAEVSNMVSEVYVLQNLNLKRTVMESARADLELLLGRRLKAKKEAETKNSVFETKHNISAVGTRRKEVEGERRFYNDKVLEATGKLIRAEAELAAVKSGMKKGIYGVGVAEVIRNPMLNSLKIQYTKLANEVTDAELVYGPKHIRLIGAKRKLGTLKSAIRKEIKGIFSATVSRKNAAQAEKSQFEQKFAASRMESEELGVAIEDWDVLQKELKERTVLYDRIRKRYEDTVITTSLAANNVRILDQALVPQRPIWPRRGMIMVTSAAFGLLLGLALILLLERADTTIRDKDHAEVTIDLPCLGLVPTIQVSGPSPDIASIRVRDLYVHDHPLSEPAEQARTLRTNLLFLSAERKLKTILITSALPEEGKTTIAVQTGITLASAGGSTVLIEADMRRPRLAPTLGLKGDRGLSTFLANRDVDVADVVQATHIPNLDAIVCGLIPPNPAELLNSLRLNQLIARLHERYDMVIIDSPPVNAVSDALVMASRVDGVLLVAKSKRTTSEALRTAYVSLLTVDAPVIGTVLNDIHRGTFGYYRKGKYYRKGYYRRSPEELEEQARQLEAS